MTAANRPLWLQVRGEKPVEGHPDDAGQARMRMSIHEEGGGAIVGPTGARSGPHALSGIT